MIYNSNKTIYLICDKTYFRLSSTVINKQTWTAMKTFGICAFYCMASLQPTQRKTKQLVKVLKCKFKLSY